MELKNRGNEYFWKSIEKKAQFELSNKINKTYRMSAAHWRGYAFQWHTCHTVQHSWGWKFAKFWICKAKLLASKGTFDVTGLYEEAIKKGATSIQELREVLSILQDSKRTAEGVTSDPLVSETNTTSVEELANKMESGQSCLSPKEKEVRGHPTSARQNRIFTLVSNYRLPQFLE